jgi:hypothetical protein
MVVELYRDNPHWTGSDVRAVVRYCHISRLIERMAEDLREQGVFKADGEPRKALDVFIRLMPEPRALEAALALSVTAKAPFAADMERLRKLAGEQEEPDLDIEALESRIVQRIKGNGDA